MNPELVILAAVRSIIDVALTLIPKDSLVSVLNEQIARANMIADAAELAKFGPVPVDAMIDTEPELQPVTEPEGPAEVVAVRGPIDQ